MTEKQIQTLPDVIDQCKFNTRDKPDSRLAFADCIDARLKNLSTIETQKTWEAPSDAKGMMEKFGVHWTGKGFEIKGTQLKFDVDENTKEMSFNTGRSSVEIVIKNFNGPDDVMLITNNSIELNANEADLSGGRGSVITFAMIKKELEKQQEKPIPQVQALFDKYGEKGWVGIKGNSEKIFTRALAADEIAVSMPVRGFDPVYFLDNGRFVKANHHDENYSPEEFDKFIQTTKHRESTN